MRVATGRVVDGRIVTEGATFPEGSVVTIVGGGEETREVTLTASEEAELLASIEAIRSGRFSDGDELLRELRQ